MQAEQTTHDIDISYQMASRCAALTTAALLLFVGMRRPARSRLYLALAAAPLAYRGMTGRWPAWPPANARDEARAALSGTGGVHVRESIRIARPTGEIYRFWRRLENLPRFMRHLESVTELGERRSHWAARGPGGLRVEWDAEIINDVESKVIGWQSLPGSDVVVAGSVNFDERAEGTTQVTVHFQYEPPAGRVGAAIAGLFGREPAQMVRDDLRELRRLLEAAPVGRSTLDDGTSKRFDHDAWTH